MSIQTIRFAGMNLAHNTHESSPGSCQELINIRSEEGSIKIDKSPKVISADIPYKRIIIHDTSGTRNFIGFDSNGIVWFNPSTGAVIKRLYSSTDNLEEIHLATVNNMLVISDKNDITNTAYLYNTDTYQLFIDKDGLDLPINITHTTPVVYEESDGKMNSEKMSLADLSYDERCELMSATKNKYFSDNKKYTMGYYLVGINFTLWDGSETRLSNLTPFYPITTPIDPSWISLRLYASSSGLYCFNFSGCVKTHHYSIRSATDLKSYKGYIKTVNVYISNPVDVIVFENDKIKFDFDIDFTNPTFGLTKTTYLPLSIQKAKLENQLLYKSASYSLDDIGKDEANADIEFGVNLLPTNKTLAVDSGLVTRTGNIQSYNNRFHFYNSRCRIDLTNGYHITSKIHTESSYTANILIYLRGPEGDVILRYDNKTFYGDPLDPMIIVQDSRAYKVVITRPGQYSEILLTSSSRYNYSYAYNKEIHFISGSDYDNVTGTGIYEEDSAINVTAQNNPISFPVDYSYAVQGNINTLGVATEPISQTQIGQYPLYIFTDRGVYALEQGSGGVLYSNMTLINTDSCNQDICQTRNGVVYISNGSVYILSGRNSLNITLPLRGPIDADIRQCPSYQLACLNADLYNIGQYLSQDLIEDYLQDAMLSYVASTDDLIVSNPNYSYSYVFSFIYREWHKITQTYARVGADVLQRYLMVNNMTDLKATGKIYVTNAVIEPAHQFSALFQASISNMSYITGFGEKYALIIDGVQVSAALFRYPTQLSVVIALLCRDIPYLDEYYDGNTYKIYSSMELRSGATLEIVNLNNKYKVISTTFADIADTVVNIPNKGIGDKITISTSGNNHTTRQISSSDTVISLAEQITNVINSYSAYGVRAMMSNNIIDLSAITAGEAGNNIAIQCSSGHYVSTYIEPMQGGRDITLAPGDYTQLVDYTQLQDHVTTIHLQSNPIHWAGAYTLIARAVLSCRANINPDQNLSIYLFASNNLKEWKCISANQKKDVILDHIRLQRSAKAYKYYTVLIGGRVHSSVELASMSLEISSSFGDKLR